MRYTAFLLLFLPLFLSAQREIINPERATYFVAYSDSVTHVGVTQPGQQTTTGQPNFIFSPDELDFLEQTDTIQVEYNPLPSVGEPVERGIYEYNSKLVICRQPHTRTNFAPEQTPALFAVYRPENAGQVLAWVPNELIYIGQKRAWDGTTYIAIQEHQTLENQTPNLIPVLWNVYTAPGTCPDWVQPTGAQDAYRLNDCVTHQGQEWINTGSDANVWEPGVFGWELKN